MRSFHCVFLFRFRTHKARFLCPSLASPVPASEPWRRVGRQLLVQWRLSSGSFSMITGLPLLISCLPLEA
jgi:hypothetical protein